MKTLFIEDEETSLEVMYYFNLLGNLIVTKVEELHGNITVRNDSPLGKYAVEVLTQHVEDLKSNKLEPSKF